MRHRAVAGAPRSRPLLMISALILLVVLADACQQAGSGGAALATPSLSPETQPDTASTSPIAWTYLSSANGSIEVAGPREQTLALVLDIDRDGLNDFVIGGRRQAPAMVWYRRHAGGWKRHVLESAQLPIEAGGAFYDVDGDGDLDVIAGEDFSGNKVYWWENPHPAHDPNVSWRRYTIKSGGAVKHHDQIVSDFDGDGRGELVFWNQGKGGASVLYHAPIPANPKATQPWTFRPIHSNPRESEGLAKADIDGDGLVDIVGGGSWLKYAGGTFTANPIDPSMHFTRAAVGQIKPGGRPEVVFVVGDAVGRLKWYEWDGARWAGRDLLGFDVDHGHSLDIADLNGDGHLDIFCAEMRLGGGNSDSRMWIFLGDGSGGFTRTEAGAGFDNHESRVADLDGDGDLDILGKPYDHSTPRLNVWLNNTIGGRALHLDRWKRHVIDGGRPWRSVFITAGDMNRDGYVDIVTGAWWYRNPGRADGSWERRTIGAPLNNMAAVYDFDGDGDLDVLGTQGKGADRDPRFVWARHDAGGQFTILSNVTQGDGDFLQGVAVGRFQPGGPLEVALSWHESGRGVQAIGVPGDAELTAWPVRALAGVSQDEGLSAGDIDRDGDTDLLLGTKWLRNDGGAWSTFTLHPTAGLPDRNRLVDLNRDGRLDAVVGFEAVSARTKVAWYEQGANPTAGWTEHVIANVVGPMSLDVGDLDQDGDLDVVVGEHNLANPGSAKLSIFENADGRGRAWVQRDIHTGDEHHDGAQLVDIDSDGDLDIISIGWGHSRVLLYENQAFTTALRLPAVGHR